MKFSKGSLTAYALIFVTFLSSILIFKLLIFNAQINTYSNLGNFYEQKTNFNNKSTKTKLKKSQSVFNDKNLGQ